MKTIYQCIFESEIKLIEEGIFSKLVSWFKNIYKSQQTLKDQKKSLKVDTKNIKGTEKPSNLKDILNNKSELELINDKNVGFPLTSAIINNKTKYLTYELNGEKHEYENLQVNRYFYIDDKNKYDIGLIVFDDTVKNENNLTTIISLEVINNVENKQEVEKFINTNFEDVKKKKFKGSQYFITNPQMSTTFTKLQYKKSNMNENILFKLFK